MTWSGPFLALFTGDVSLDDPEYNQLHCQRSARIVTAWLRQHAPARLIGEVEQLILAHETGGAPTRTSSRPPTA